MTQIRRGETRSIDPVVAAQELADQLLAPETGAVVFFCSAAYDLERLEGTRPFSASLHIGAFPASSSLGARYFVPDVALINAGKPSQMTVDANGDLLVMNLSLTADGGVVLGVFRPAVKSAAFGFSVGIGPVPFKLIALTPDDANLIVHIGKISCVRSSATTAQTTDVTGHRGCARASAGADRAVVGTSLAKIADR